MKMNVKLLIPLSMALISCLAQRPPYAGRRPIGYPEIEAAPTSGTNDLLANKFGTDGNDTECSNLPIEALGDCELVKKLLKFPMDKQPFWLLNWKALDANRKSPQTYPSKPNPFIDTSSNQAANRFGQNPQPTDPQISNQPTPNNQNPDQINGNVITSQSTQGNQNFATSSLNQGNQNTQQVQNQNRFANQPIQGNQNFATSSLNQGNQNTQQIQNQNRFSNQPIQGNQNFATSSFNQGNGNFGIMNTQQIQNQNRFSNIPTAANSQSSIGNRFSNQNGNRVESFAFANNNQASSFSGVFTNQNNIVRPSNNGQGNTNNQHEGDLNDFITSRPNTNKPSNSDTYKLFAEELNKKPFTSS